MYVVQRRVPITPQPKAGDSKSVLRFAYLPHIVENSATRVWLERYEVLYVWKVDSVESIVEGKVIAFKYGAWAKVDERLAPPEWNILWLYATIILSLIATGLLTYIVLHD